VLCNECVERPEEVGGQLVYLCSIKPQWGGVNDVDVDGVVDLSSAAGCPCSVVLVPVTWIVPGVCGATRGEVGGQLVYL
jgi:hypothetical protein